VQAGSHDERRRSFDGLLCYELVGSEARPEEYGKSLSASEKENSARQKKTGGQEKKGQERIKGGKTEAR
jgi:hypothetical protein